MGSCSLVLKWWLILGKVDECHREGEEGVEDAQHRQWIGVTDGLEGAFRDR